MRAQLRWVGLGWASLGIVASLVVACKSAEQREIAQEVARISFAVQALRNAPHNDKGPPLERLRAEPCATGPGCELQGVCVQGYAIAERVGKTTRSVREAIANGSANLEGAGELLKLNETELVRAKRLMDECVALEGRLAREYR